MFDGRKLDLGGGDILQVSSPPPTDFETQRQLEVLGQLEALQAENARLRAVIAETHRLTADPDRVK